jgi:hypothetical protein
MCAATVVADYPNILKRKMKHYRITSSLAVSDILKTDMKKLQLEVVKIASMIIVIVWLLVV